MRKVFFESVFSHLWQRIAIIFNRIKAVNPYVYLILAGWLSGMGIVVYVVFDRIRRAAHKRELDKRLAALNPPPPGQNHDSLPRTTYRLEPALPRHKENQAEKYAEYQAQQAKWKLWQQLKKQPLPEA